ncbi:MAG TPA: hypothetical protein VGD29_21415 [Actinoplanes sp.]|jgi:hypothetical protein
MLIFKQPCTTATSRCSLRGVPRWPDIRLRRAPVASRSSTQQPAHRAAVRHQRIGEDTEEEGYAATAPEQAMPHDQVNTDAEVRMWLPYHGLSASTNRQISAFERANALHPGQVA